MPFLDDTGTTFIAKVVTEESSCKATPVDLTDATVVFRFRKPSGDTEDVTAEVTSASKGIAKYTVGAGFLDEVGLWQWQVHVTTPDGAWYAPVEDFSVSAHL